MPCPLVTGDDAAVEGRRRSASSRATGVPRVFWCEMRRESARCVAVTRDRAQDLRSRSQDCRSRTVKKRHRCRQTVSRGSRTKVRSQSSRTKFDGVRSRGSFTRFLHGSSRHAGSTEFVTRFLHGSSATQFNGVRYEVPSQKFATREVRRSSITRFVHGSSCHQIRRRLIPGSFTEVPAMQVRRSSIRVLSLR